MSDDNIEKYKREFARLEKQFLDESKDDKSNIENIEDIKELQEYIEGDVKEGQEDYNTYLIIKPIYTGNCRICQWSKKQIQLYNWICEQARTGLSDRKLHEVTLERATELKLDVKVPGFRSFWKHFSKHLQVKDLATIKNARGHYTPSFSERTISEEGMESLEQAIKGNFDEYQELCKLYIRFREIHGRVYEFDNSLKIACPSGDVWSQRKIQTYISMVNTMRSVLGEIAKMRQSDRLIKLATEHSLKIFTKGIVGKLTEEFGVLSDIMKRRGIEKEVLEAFAEVTNARLATIIMNEADVALDSTSKEFKLPH